MSTAIQKTAEQTPQQKLLAALEVARPSIEKVLPAHLTANRLFKVISSATSRNPKLLNCTIPSIVKSVMQAAELGLEIGGLLGHVYLVPYNNRNAGTTEAQAIVGYQGLLMLARNSGEIENISAHVIYKSDIAHINVADAIIKHEMNLEGNRDNENILAAYCMVHLKGGGRHLEVMTKGDIEKIRKRSKSGNDGPWVTDYSEMARKTVTRRACKWIPRSSEKAAKLDRALELDIEAEGVDATDPKPSLKERLIARAETSTVQEKVLPNGEVVELSPDGIVVPDHVGREPGDD